MSSLGAYRRFLALVVAAVTTGSAAATPAGMEMVPGGSFVPLFDSGVPKDEKGGVRVEPFLLDVVPTSDRSFADFVRAVPEWRRDRVKRLFAEPGYLRHWPTPEGPDPKTEGRPVVHVSWHAAKAYCAWTGKRLPTDLEWQYAAYEGAVDHAQRLTEWYSKPATTELPRVGATPANRFRIHDMYGPIWEWVGDFSSLMVGNDGRAAAATDDLKFCGAGAVSATESRNYIGFMRAAYLNSLKADYTTSSLGLRCARSVEEPTK